MNKYRNKKVVDPYTGYTFDSKKEYRRWQELDLLEDAGKIMDLRRQVAFELLPAVYETVERYDRKSGRMLKRRHCVERSVVYVADFVYIANGREVVEDAKGKRTDVYIIKRKLMLNKYGIRVKEV